MPEIQSSYVWKRPKFEKLLDSIYRGYLTGSILLWDTIQPIQLREMATNLGHQVQPDFNPKIVMDGQQRMTSLGRVSDAIDLIEESFDPSECVTWDTSKSGWFVSRDWRGGNQS